MSAAGGGVPDQVAPLYAAIDRWVHSVMRWERCSCRFHAADVAQCAGHVLLALDEAGEGPVSVSYRAFARIQEEWLAAAAEWAD